LPTIAGQVVDLHLLYNTVISHGGWDKVNDRQLWPTIATNFSIDSSCLNGTQALKNIYIRYDKQKNLI
jgi:AT-rich interactive domain-containing protein 2